MKKLIFIFVLLAFTSILFPQKRINWAEDPVNIFYNGSSGMITIKYLDNPKCITLGASGKKTIGMGGKGMIIDIDSLNFFSGKTISSGIVFACANPTEFPDGLNRSKIIIVKKTILNKTIQFVQCDSLQSLARSLNLLRDEIGDISESVWQLNKKVTNIQNTINENKESTFSFWNSPWPYVIGGAIITTIVIILLHHDHDTVIPTTDDSGKGPGGHTGPVFKIVLGI